MKFAYRPLVNGAIKFDHIKRLITLTSDYIKRLRALTSDYVAQPRLWLQQSQRKSSLKPSLHIRFPYAFTKLHFFYYLGFAQSR